MKLYFSAEMPDHLVPDFLQVVRDFDTRHDPKHKGHVHFETMMETDWPVERAEAIFKGLRPAPEFVEFIRKIG